MCWGIECGDGWYDLIRSLCLEIKILDKDSKVRAVQVKEKFGGLRFYIDYGTEEIYNKIDMAEEISFSICEECGKPGKLRNGEWLKTLCNDCAKHV